MSIDNIVLTPNMLQELYKRSLVADSTTQPQQASSLKKNISFLGKNQKQIIILVSNEEVLYLPDEQLSFLLGILAACKLTMEDVAIINLKKNEGFTYKIIAEELSAEKIFLFGVEPSQIEMPIQFPHYQIQKYNQQLYVAAPMLSVLQDEKAEKMKLWTCLKTVFSI